MPQLAIHEILGELSKQKSDKKKVEVLKKHDKNVVLKKVLYLNFAEGVKFSLPEGDVPYKPSKDEYIDLANSNLYMAAKTFGLFVEGVSKVKQAKREDLFIRMLESIAVPEAELMIALKDKKLEEKFGVTRQHVEEAYPGIFTIPAARVLQR